MIFRSTRCCLDWNGESSLKIFEQDIDEGREDAFDLTDHRAWHPKIGNSSEKKPVTGADLWAYESSTSC